MTSIEIADYAEKGLITIIGIVSGYLFKKVETLENRTTVIETRDEAKIASINEIKQGIKEMQTNIKSLETYVHENVHKQNNQAAYLQPMITKIYEHIIQHGGFGSQQK